MIPMLTFIRIDIFFVRTGLASEGCFGLRGLGDRTGAVFKATQWKLAK